jgi:phosphatidylethanolamine/phosphatidyl-N-methylethanolamine N-methyltransferase
LQSVSSFYNRITFFYPAINFFLEAHRHALVNEVNSANPGTLLEIGIGDGSHLPLYEHHQITGIDVSEVMLRKARRSARPGTTLCIMNGEHLLFPETSFDYVVLSHVLAVTPHPDRLLAEVYRVLRPGGRLFVLNHFTPGNWLRYIDWAFQPLSSIFHFRSLFYVEQIEGLQRFRVLKERSLGSVSYFKLLILVKP